MKRDAHKAAVQQKILSVARRLFLNQGYEETTIRQIAAITEIKTGSIYHFFKNKDTIFLEVAIGAFHRVLKRVDQLIDREQTALHLACEMAWHTHVMTQDAKAAELYVITYNSAPIAAAILEHQKERSRLLFQQREPSLTEMDHLSRAMLAKGMMQSIALRAKAEQIDEPGLLIDKFLGLFFRAVGFGEDEIDDTLEALRKLNLEAQVISVLEAGRVLV